MYNIFKSNKNDFFSPAELSFSASNGLIHFTILESDIIRDYYNFIVQSFKKLKLRDDFAIIGSIYFHSKGEKVILVNYEHNLVHPILGGEVAFKGNVPVIDNSKLKYHVRIEKVRLFLKSDFYIEYSRPNIENIKSCKKLSPFLTKIIYVPPLLCEYAPLSENRNEYNVITSFYILENEERPRRKVLFDQLKQNFPGYCNIPKVFGNDLYHNFYKKAKILINIHQTDYHHTFEELRVLPALLNGLIVIAEDSPLKETIPYHEFIIWTRYEDVIEVTKKVLTEYDFYYNKIHGNSNLQNVINNMKTELSNELASKFELEKPGHKNRFWFAENYLTTLYIVKKIKLYFLQYFKTR